MEARSFDPTNPQGLKRNIPKQHRWPPMWARRDKYAVLYRSLQRDKKCPRKRLTRLERRYLYICDNCDQVTMREAKPCDKPPKGTIIEDKRLSETRQP